MTHSSPLDDLDYLRDLAESGAGAPSISGRFYLWWAGLAVVAMTVHGAALTGIVPIGSQFVGLIWLAYAIIGWTGSGFLTRGLSDKPGQSSPANRASSAFWSAAGPGIFIVSIAMAAAVILRDAPTIIFDLIPAFAFFAYGCAYIVEARLERVRWKVMAGIGGLAACALMIVLIGSAIAYFAAAAATVLLGIVPGALMMSREPSQTV